MSECLVEAIELKKYFEVRSGVLGKKRPLKAVDGVSFKIMEGETLSLVGESGCGKSTIGRLVLKLLPVTGGKILLNGVDVTNMSENQIRSKRKNMQMVFQDPYASLNPRIRIKDLVSEPLLVHTDMDKSARYEKARELLEIVGLSKDSMEKFAHEFSGGQRQRIGIARAISVNPRLIVADEPVSALDVSIQSQVLNLLLDLQRDLKLTFLFISHNLSVVEHISDRICVMYLGKIVETANKTKLYDNPMHPYTRALFSAVPIPDPTRKRNRIILKGDIPSPVNPPPGCSFHTRCNNVMDICKTITPTMQDVGEGHMVSCHMFS
jgi:oligopeptide/dipeptide ABC transporter ATP-binding protein